MDHERYLDRIGIESPPAETLTVATLERLQQAHVKTVPFETLSITGDPYGSHSGTGVSLAHEDLFEKIAVRDRGGFCYELNGLFWWLLDELGVEVRRLAARIKSDGTFGPPADHLTLLASLDQQYLVDVGFGIPKLRRPLPLDGTVHEDEAGIGWRVVESDRPDADYAVEYQQPGSDDWATRCIFSDVHREMRYFEATCEYFQHAPESAFTGDPVVTLASDRGHVKLSPTALTRSIGGEVEKRSINEGEWYRLLEEVFGIPYPPGCPDN